MNQPTREEFEAFKQELRQQIREQVTEEIEVIRGEVTWKIVLDRLDNLKHELDERSNIWLNTLQEHYTEHTARFEKIESTMATKEDIEKRFDSIAEVQKLILERLPKPPEG